MAVAAVGGAHLMFEDPGVRLRNPVMVVEAEFVASSTEVELRSAYQSAVCADLHYGSSVL